MKHRSRPVSFESFLDPQYQYTYVGTISKRVFARARKADGSPVYAEIDYTPIYYLPTDDVTQADAKGYDGTPLQSFMCDSIKDGKEFLEKHPEAFGDIQPEYMLLSDTYGKQDAPFDMDRLYIWNLDIEVARDPVRGHAPVEDPFNAITAITVKWTHMGQSGIVCYGTKPYVAKPDETYVPCKDEHELVAAFLTDLKGGGDYPDIFTGWNVQGHDIPYFVNRAKKLFPEEIWSAISPFEWLSEKTAMFYGQEHLNIDVKGIAILDYYELYRKFTYTQQENYKLDHIAHTELGRNKVDYKKHRSLDKLYDEDHQKFIEYNINDVKLVDELDQKLKLIELVCALAYMAKVNFPDTFKQVRLWDIMIYHRLRGDGFQIPPRQTVSKTEQYEGAFVKEPNPGMYRWVVSFDVASMYPHIIREWNLSPETILDKLAVPPVNDLLQRKLDTGRIRAQHGDVSIAANGVLTRKTVEGFLPNMLKTLYDERVKFKKIAHVAEKELEQTTDPAERKRLIELISASNKQQQVRKVNLNSAYGALGSNYFRFFDVRLAEAVTVTGQLFIRWVAQELNAYLNMLLKTKDEDYVIASDTDSVYVRLEKVVEAYTNIHKPAIFTTAANIQETVNMLDKFCNKALQPVIQQAFVGIADYLNVYVPCLSMPREVIADKGVWTAKKRYILNMYNKEGEVYEKPRLKMMGIEAIKSSTPSICRAMIKEVINLLMNGTQEEVWTHIAECRKKFFEAPFEDIAFPRSVSGLLKYADSNAKAVPIAVKGALTFNEALQRFKLTHLYEPIREGEKIKFVHLREPNRFFSHVISAPGYCPPEWDIEKQIDYEEQWEKSFIVPMDAILSCVGWSTKHEASLFD